MIASDQLERGQYGGGLWAWDVGEPEQPNDMQLFAAQLGSTSDTFKTAGNWSPNST